MSASTTQKQITNLEDADLEITRTKTCSRCGGNGYTKTSPDCYKTCLNCLGTGITDC